MEELHKIYKDVVKVIDKNYEEHRNPYRYAMATFNLNSTMRVLSNNGRT